MASRLAVGAAPADVDAADAGVAAAVASDASG